jgi:hypothetical protein
MSYVWVASECDYGETRIIGVFPTPEHAALHIKGRYSPPSYIVEWKYHTENDDEVTLVGAFEQVDGYSTKHKDYFSLVRFPILG